MGKKLKKLAALCLTCLLYTSPADGVRVVAAPNLGLVVVHGRVISSASAAAAAENNVRMGQDDLVHDMIKSKDIPMVDLTLAAAVQKGGPGFVQTAVHIPFDVFNPGLGKEAVDGIGQIGAYIGA